MRPVWQQRLQQRLFARDVSLSKGSGLYPTCLMHRLAAFTPASKRKN
jgi:hypothetical protein